MLLHSAIVLTVFQASFSVTTPEPSATTAHSGKHKRSSSCKCGMRRQGRQSRRRCFKDEKGNEKCRIVGGTQAVSNEFPWQVKSRGQTSSIQGFFLTSCIRPIGRDQNQQWKTSILWRFHPQQKDNPDSSTLHQRSGCFFNEGGCG